MSEVSPPPAPSPPVEWGFRVEDWGRCEYGEAWARQLVLKDQVLAGGEDVLVLVEHDPVFTLGASFHQEHLLVSPSECESRGIAVFPNDRGGDVTYHGPGQLTIYPIFDVSRHGRDLHKWMRDLEETMILVALEFGLSAARFPPNTGVWISDMGGVDSDPPRPFQGTRGRGVRVEGSASLRCARDGALPPSGEVRRSREGGSESQVVPPHPRPSGDPSPPSGRRGELRKLAAIGVKITRWVSIHGIALNCDNDLAPFGLIVPCGIRGHSVTSISQEAGGRITIEEAKPAVIRAFQAVFGAEPRIFTE